MDSVAYHNVLQRAGDQQVLVVMMNESAGDFAQLEKEFNGASREFSCLVDGRVHLMLCGIDERARFIASEDGEPGLGASLPTITFFRRSRREARFVGGAGEEWKVRPTAAPPKD